MNELMFLDTETTGKGPDDRLIQLGFSAACVDESGTLKFRSCDFAEHSYKKVFKEPNILTPTVYQYNFKPDVPVNLEAMAVHHITPEMLEDKQRFQESTFLDLMKEASNIAVMVAHNAPFDISVMDREGVRFHKWIDTCKVAKHLLDQPSYQLQYLRYALGLYRLTGPVAAHEASGDVTVLVYLFAYLFEWIKADKPEWNSEQIISYMMDLSRMPVEIKTFSFGKYMGQTIESVSKLDAGYLEWLYNSESKKLESEQNKDLLHTLILWLSKKSI